MLEGCPVHCKKLSDTAGLCPLKDSQKCPQTLLKVPRDREEAKSILAEKHLEQFMIHINKYDFNSNARSQHGLRDFLKKYFIRPYRRVFVSESITTVGAQRSKIMFSSSISTFNI